MFILLILQIQFAIKGSLAGNTQKSSSGQNQQKQVIEIVEDQDDITVTDFEIHSDVVPIVAEKNEIELVVPLARTIQSIDFQNDQFDYDPQRSASLRPKTHSRQSHGDGEDTSTGYDIDWPDTISDDSSNSNIAHKLILPDDKKYDPITFEELCAYLESIAGIPATEEEILVICRRIVKMDDFVKALNLPIYLRGYELNINAIKVHDILYSYLGQSGDLMSRCSSRASHSSTIETPPNSPIQTPPISPIVHSRNDSPDPEQLCSSIPEDSIEQQPVIEIVQEIPKGRPHTNSHLNFFIRGSVSALPSGSFTRFGFRNFPPFANHKFSLDSVKEERFDSTESIINEID